MAFHWTRAVARALAPLALAIGALLPYAAHAAKADPCRTNAKSAACKSQQAKKASAKKAPAKTASSKKSASTAKKKSASSKKTASAKKGSTRKSTIRARTRTARASAAATAAMPPAAASPAAEAAALRSSTAYVQDLETSTVLFAKNENVVRPIASISKLMTALVVVDANLPMDEMIEITDDDVDTLKHTTSRLRVGTVLSRGDMLHLALMSSENRAAHALGRNYPGGMPAFVAAMNAKARSLGMLNTHFVEPTGLSSENVSSPRDLARMLRAASQRPLIHRYSTDTEYEVEINNRTQTFRNTNLLVRKPDWDIKVSKTGFINEAGECLVMLARINGRDMAIVLLDSQGKLSRIGDAVRIRRIVQNDVAML
ncbi:D-alanyl-D-alanine endopeptidase [Bordetella parapertussis]|nr:D-alanyl-D-alanine endopeptidase [Bordetella parapertussis]AOB38461.1 D-alanyl-D-alanine carboxypeptidase [Bordetella parapertussis]AUL42444.1 D-alanyl-D-alanine endopeptidase [Bordetella parapertussis]AWP62357.1 D-alanyl-D-alanine endopeptidase [Bordetella parapertussis]AWP69858.1 D-alanyl-D-alanine endopeptidase [Bordetella parapertussis]AWP88448.1 D-alanyl-D-alanine endopeptidase [Bordetella parapertussis]